MLNIKSNNGNLELDMSGTIDTITSELVYASRRIYEGIKEHDERAGKAFKDIMSENFVRLVFADDILSAISDSCNELLQKLNDMKAEKQQNSEKKEELSDLLQDLLDRMKDESDED